MSAVLEVPSGSTVPTIGPFTTVNRGGRTTGLTVSVAAASSDRFVFTFLDVLALPTMVDGGVFSGSVVTGRYVGAAQASIHDTMRLCMRSDVVLRCGALAAFPAHASLPRL
jgi:hypothetical protein